MPNLDTVLLNKQNYANQKMTFKFFTTKFHRARWKQKQPFTFWYCVDNFYPWKDIVGKKVLKLRSIAELSAFYGCFRFEMDNTVVTDYKIFCDGNIMLPIGIRY